MKKYIKPEIQMIKINGEEMLIALSGTEANSLYPGGGDARGLDFDAFDLGGNLDQETLDFENIK